MRKDEFIGMISMMVAVYIFVNLLTTCIGMGEGFSHREREGCNKPTSRIGYVMPGYNFGCWLSEVPK
jgi:hypothetical protein